MGTYQDDLMLALKVDLEAGLLRDIGNSATPFSRLKERFPVSGSKIDWSKVPGALVEDLNAADVASRMRAIHRHFKLSSETIYAGDSLTDSAIAGPFDTFVASLPLLLDIPQHHYFMGTDAAWCFVITMECDFCFGLSRPEGR